MAKDSKHGKVGEADTNAALVMDAMSFNEESDEDDQKI